jgi:hypothetical protein
MTALFDLDAELAKLTMFRGRTPTSTREDRKGTSAPDTGTQSIPIDTGKLAIAPAGAWHRFDDPDGVTLMTITPGQSEYVRADVTDPLSAEVTRD